MNLSISDNGCYDDEIAQLNSYATCETIMPGSIIHLGITKIDPIKYTCPNDLSIIDIV